MDRFALVAVIIPLVGAGVIGLAAGAQSNGPRGQGGRTFTETLRWIAATTATFAFGVLVFSTAVDWAVGPRGSAAVGNLFALLTAAVWLPVLVSARDCDGKRPCLLYALLLLLEAATLGVFLADDVRWFCLSLETSTLVLFLLIGGWGRGQNEAIARKFLFYNLAGDMLVLIALLGVVVAAARMSSESVSGPRHHLSYSLSALIQDVPRLASEDISGQEYWGHARRWLLTALIAGLALKTPLAPFHTWFAAAVAEGPLCFGVALLGAGSRVGAYAFVRIAGPLCGEFGAWGDLLIALIIFGAFYESLLTRAHGDLRKMTGCASLSQSSLAIAGFFTLQRWGHMGAVLVTLAGGLAFSLLLFSVGSLEQRFGTRDLSAVQGIWRRMPQLAGVVIFAVLSLIGVPALCGFPGLYSVLAALFASDWLTAILAMFAGLIVAWALLWMLERVVFGPGLPDEILDSEEAAFALKRPPAEEATDFGPRDLLPIAPLIAGSILLGIRPQAVIEFIQTSLGISLSP